MSLIRTAGPQVLRDRTAARLSVDHDQGTDGGDVGVGLGVAGAHIVRADIRRLVHDGRPPGGPGPASRRVYVRGQQAVRHSVV